MLTTNQAAENDIFYSSAIIEHIVPQDKAPAFQQWLQNLIRHTQQFEGFVNAHLPPPLECKNDVSKWYLVMHFDSPGHLNAWLTAPDRKELMKTGQPFFETYRFKSFTTGLEGWFSCQTGTELSSLGPSAWKQALVVVLGLYPVVFLQSKLFEFFGIMQSWSYANSLLVNLIITTIILTWFVMPQLTRILEFWLQPAYAFSKTKTEWGGIIAIVLATVAMIGLFNY